MDRKHEDSCLRAQAEALLAVTREPMLVLDTDLRVLGASRSFCHVFRLEDDQVEGRLIYDLGDGAWRVPQLNVLLEEHLPAQGSIRDFQIVHTFKKLGQRILLINASKLQVDPARELILLGISDVTGYVDGARPDDPAALRLMAIVNNSDDAIVSKGLDGVITSWNRAAERMFGYTAEEAVGQSIKIIIPPELYEEEEQVLSQLSAGQTIDHFETTRRRKDGMLLNISLTVSPIRAPNGHIIGASKIARDITAQKRIQAKVVENERRLHDLIDALPAAIYTTDAQGRITMFNRAAVEFVGRVPNLEIDRWCVAWKLLRSDGTVLPHDQCPMAVALKEDRAVRGEELWLERPDGTRAACIPYPTPLHDASGKLVGGVNMVVDITDRKQAEETLREADRNKTEFLGILAHELRNPLAPISHALSLMGIITLDPQRAEELRTMMERQVEHLSRLIEDLMDVSRISRRKLDLKRERVGLSDLIASAEESLRPVIEDADQVLTVDAPEHDVLLDADPTRITQVIANLLSNASKYSPPDSAIELAWRREDNEVLIEVRDHGMGIPHEKIPTIFKLFSQLEESVLLGREGLGVGLTLVKTLVELHEGTVSVHSDGPGQGCTFTVRLPMPADLHVSDDAPAEPEQAASDARFRVLVVEDHPLVGELFVSLLNEMGHEVRLTTNGFDALQQIQADRPDIVFSDLSMPGMSGYEFARQVREQPQFRDLTLVALSGYGLEDDQQRGLDAGFNYHLVKPASMTTLNTLFATLSGEYTSP